MGYDTVLTGDTDLAVSQTMRCVKPGGRCIMFRTSRPSAENSQAMHGAPPTVSLSIIQLGEVPFDGNSVSPELLRRVLEPSSLLGAKTSGRQSARFPASDIAGAFSHLR
ncbi:hypothetical protein F4779DRAFT_304907 [Xylariaceae sp. FL0662B]|nr:hypothetical protein F4779DRAFT_304907 [Xylariaceae sp. FL0662B]